jgi:hypothetical protein
MFTEQFGTVSRQVSLLPLDTPESIRTRRWFKATRSLRSISKGMVARWISRNVRFPSSNMPKAWSVC